MAKTFKFIKLFGQWVGSIAFLGFLNYGCSPTYEDDVQIDSLAIIIPINPAKEYKKYIKIDQDVTIGDYFKYLDSIITIIDTCKNWTINEYSLIHYNPRIIDTLKASDYYLQSAKGVFIYDQSKKVVLHQNDSLAIPDSMQTVLIQKKLNSSILDVNIPEYTLRLIQLEDTVLKTKVRVGRREKKYLELARHEVDFRTPVGKGKIIRVEKNPLAIDPETAIPYEGTLRDDGRFTKIPLIPWLEPEINNVRYGALIHPTTNQKTLGSAYSHGCIGTSESDAWVIYYNAPIGTNVNFRYDLKVTNDKGDSITLPDIYNIKKQKR